MATWPQGLPTFMCLLQASRSYYSNSLQALRYVLEGWWFVLVCGGCS